MEEEVYRIFEKLLIKYDVIEHKALFSASDGTNVNFNGSVCCKNLLLKDKKSDDKYLVSLEITKKANLKAIQEQLHIGKLTFCTEEELYEELKVRSGSVSILNIICNPSTDVNFLIDKELLKKNKVCFHPNINTKSVCFLPENIEKILNYYNASYSFIDM